LVFGIAAGGIKALFVVQADYVLSQMSAIVMVPAIVPIYSSALIIQNPDGGLVRVRTCFPLTAPTASMM
jgi:hypothetical protein